MLNSLIKKTTIKEQKMNYDITRLVKLPTPRDLRKLAKADKVIAKSISTPECAPEFYIANAKQMNFFLSKKEAKAIDREYGADRVLRYYRKRYGNEGVTEVAKRYTSSRPFLKSFFLKLFTVNDGAGKKEIVEMLQKRSPKKWNG